MNLWKVFNYESVKRNTQINFYFKGKGVERGGIKKEGEGRGIVEALKN